MTVKELILQLEELPPDEEIVFKDSRGVHELFEVVPAEPGDEVGTTPAAILPRFHE